MMTSDPAQKNSKLELEIFFETITSNDKRGEEFIEEIGGAGEYLYIKSSQSKKPTYIKKEEYDDSRRRALAKIAPEAFQAQIENGSLPIETAPMKPERPNLKGLLGLFSDSLNLKEVEELVVSSNLGDILELPWEDTVSLPNFIIVYRKVSGCKKEESRDQSKGDETCNKMLVMISCAHVGLEDPKTGIDEEVKNIFNIFLENNNGFRIERFMISNHTTKKVIKELECVNFSHVHITMHGSSNGNLCLENPSPDEYKTPDPITVECFLNELKEARFRLIFLSVCYSGGSVDDGKESLAVQLVKSGITLYSIGYNHRTGEKSVNKFAESFYKYLRLRRGDVGVAYKEALNEYSQQAGNRQYLPLLYESDNLRIQ